MGTSGQTHGTTNAPDNGEDYPLAHILFDLLICEIEVWMSVVIVEHILYSLPDEREHGFQTSDPREVHHMRQ